ncbi:hypothetical protein CEXT_696511 [Caerostris extrusa]|uniref:Secreted protein n=1 Tax=Caerostris extrusa TaxID=172846 RepID=A0AAV4S6A5_CAEEX|nr:hypothetical protein CEXT_696511 [Caerostris extrusa]
MYSSVTVMQLQFCFFVSLPAALSLLQKCVAVGGQMRAQIPASDSLIGERRRTKECGRRAAGILLVPSKNNEGLRESCCAFNDFAPKLRIRERLRPRCRGFLGAAPDRISSSLIHEHCSHYTYASDSCNPSQGSPLHAPRTPHPGSP